ncbi:MAG: VTT domain-containing protein [Chloroflexota bacterium]|nr:VTT domain-containing protein [Chloroflexota bacterium]
MLGAALGRIGHTLGVKRYWTVAGLVLVGLLVLFLVVEALEVPLLADPSPWLERGGPVAALVGTFLLTIDVLLPVPSNVVMLANGALYGVVVGTLLSLTGSMGAAVAAFAIGRRGGKILDAFVPASERRRADRLLARWGVVAIVVSRPLPLLAETVMVLAGASPLGWSRSMLAATLGLLPPCLLYALVGATAIGLREGALTFGLVLLIAATLGLAARQVEARRAAA